MALHWYPGRRHELEEPLLHHYHRGLLSHGVDAYSFGDLMRDYRRCVVRNLTIPISVLESGYETGGVVASARVRRRSPTRTFPARSCSSRSPAWD
jgi:hypothetical protein